MEMENTLTDEVKDMFLRGEHVCRHSDGKWNSVFSDQFGEQTYIRYGKAKGGLIGLTLSSEQVATWVLSHHVCNLLSLLMDDMYDKPVRSQPHHKELGCEHCKCVNSH